MRCNRLLLYLVSAIGIMLSSCNKNDDTQNFGYIDDNMCLQIKKCDNIKWLRSDKEMDIQDLKNLTSIVKNINNKPWGKNKLPGLAMVFISISSDTGKVFHLRITDKAWSLWDPQRPIFNQYKKGYPKWMQYDNQEEVHNFFYKLSTFMQTSH